jgi:hypothetical protein
VIEMQKKLRSGSWIGAVMAVVLLGGPVVGSAWAGGGARIVDPHPKTIVRITGDAANGFGIHYFDGTADFPPTDSEARAECSEYDTRVARVRCRTEVRTWYRDLGGLRQALDWAHAR